MNNPIVRKYGSRAILMEWEAVISPKINAKVVQTAAYLTENCSDWIEEIVPSYQSLLIFIKEDADLERHIEICRYVNISISRQNEKGILWNIPVCYDLAFGLDLESISQTRKLSIETIIQLHTESIYRIYGIGFLPGFLYLGGLNEGLFSPRRRVVKRFAPKGSVAIGGQQTGIYPQESPGGWNIIGRTPVELFNPKADEPTPFSIGDSIQFYSIIREEFDEIEREIAQNTFNLTSTV